MLTFRKKVYTFFPLKRFNCTKQTSVLQVIKLMVWFYDYLYFIIFLDPPLVDAA